MAKVTLENSKIVTNLTNHDRKTNCYEIHLTCSNLQASCLSDLAGSTSGRERVPPLYSANAYYGHAARLKSFERWPHFGRRSALAFSKAGFYYAGVGDAVTCSFCGLTLKQWTPGVQPAAAHAELSGGRCAFIKEANRRCPRDADGRALSASEIGSAIRQSARSGGIEVTSTRELAATSIMPPASIAIVSVAAEIIAGVAIGDLSRMITSLDVPVRAIFSDPNKCDRGHASLASVCGPLSKQAEQPNTYELHRLETYTNRWKYNSIVSAQELASAGFCYAGPSDRVQCTFCQGTLQHWESGDRAMVLHAKHFTYCRFVQGHDVGNVPIPFFPLKGEHATALEPRTRDETDSSLGISCAAPKHPDMADESRRQATFVTWPGSRGSLTVDALAKAGFFYLGAEKLVKCFYCDGVVGNWPENADPWVEHIRRYPTCTFVSHTKGRAYVEQTSSSTVGSACGTRSAAFAVDRREIRARMDTPKARILLCMDYPVDLIGEAIQKHLASTGDDHETSDALLAEVFSIHDEKQRSLRPEVVQCQQLHPALPVVLVATAAAAYDPGDVGAPTENIALAVSASRMTARREEEATAVTGIAYARWVEPLIVPPSIGVGRPIDVPSGKACEENAQLKMELTCKICMDGLIGIAFTPCGHFVCCPACAPALIVCPICRVSIRGTVRCTL